VGFNNGDRISNLSYILVVFYNQQKPFFFLSSCKT
jgi:hypothetical protein